MRPTHHHLSDLYRGLPNLSSLAHEAPQRWRSELSAGVTTATLLIPQSMAYAMLAGLPPQVGLYASTLPILAYALLGSCKNLSVGPVAMDSMLTMSTLAGLATIQSAHYIELATILALGVGISLILMSIGRLGELVRHLSPSMMSGFTSAAAIMIGLSQLKHLVGAPLERSATLQATLLESYSKLDQISYKTLLIGLISLLMFKGLPRVSSRLPAGLIGVVLMTALSALLGFQEWGVAVVQEVPAGLPEIALPSLDTLIKVLSGEHAETFIGGMLSIALLAFMEAIAVGGAVSKPYRYEVRPGQELFALGAANVASSLVGGYPVAGGFSRTAVNDRAGAQTPLASLVTLVAVALVVWQLTPILYTLPKSTLAAMIIAAVAGLVNLKAPWELWQNDRAELIVWLGTFSATLTLGLQVGILIGVGLSLLSLSPLFGERRAE